MTSTASEEITLDEARTAHRVIEYCYDQEWTDGLPVVPPLEELVREFIDYSGRDAQEVIARADHLDRNCTLELAAINSVMAGCRPEHFPVVVAAIQALDVSSGPKWAWCQSTSGQAQLVIVNGPVRDSAGFNSKVNVFGDGFRANATVGRAVRLVIMNAFGIRPLEFDQSTQGNPLKYTACIAENEEESPWEPWHLERGYAADSSVVTALYVRSSLHVQTGRNEPEYILGAIADAMSVSASWGRGFVVAMCPQHARLIADKGWSKAQAKQFLAEHAGGQRADLKGLGAERAAGDGPDDEFVRFGDPDQILLVVTGGFTNAISTVIPASDRSFDTQEIHQR